MGDKHEPDKASQRDERDDVEDLELEGDEASEEIAERVKGGRRPWSISIP